MAAIKKQVVFVIFENFNTLDLNGPQEVLKNYAVGSAEDQQIFDISVAAECEITMMETVVMVLESGRFNTARRSDAFKFWAPSMAIVFFFEEKVL